MFAYLGGIFCHFASLQSSHSVEQAAESCACQQRQLLSNLQVAERGATPEPCWRNTVRHRNASLAGPNRPGGVLERPIWEPRLRPRSRNVSKFSSTLLSKGLKGICHLLMPNPLIFLKPLIRSWLRNPELSKKKKKKKSFGGLQAGINGRAYGNYALIYHLGRGD